MTHSPPDSVADCHGWPGGEDYRMTRLGQAGAWGGGRWAQEEGRIGRHNLEWMLHQQRLLHRGTSTPTITTSNPYTHARHTHTLTQQKANIETTKATTPHPAQKSVQSFTADTNHHPAGQGFTANVPPCSPSHINPEASPPTQPTSAAPPPTHLKTYHLPTASLEAQMLPAKAPPPEQQAGPMM